MDNRFHYDGFYTWSCPKCGDVCRDPANVHESMCHRGHLVRLDVTQVGYKESMVATLV